MTVIFTNCIDFALLAKESTSPILTQKSEGRWVSGISETNFPILVYKTGSRLRENFGGNWKTYRDLPSLKIWKGSDKNWGRN